jgi:hypothetical protein
MRDVFAAPAIDDGVGAANPGIDLATHDLARGCREQKPTGALRVEKRIVDSLGRRVEQTRYAHDDAVT